jgi:hypothetical protein
MNPPTKQSERAISFEMGSELYPRVLGENWLRLHESIRCAHSIGAEMRGSFRISYGERRLAKLLARWSHLPQNAASADTRLKILPEFTGERWERRFDGDIFTTRQWQEGGLLVERFREWEMYFKLREENGSLYYDQCAAKLCLGVLRLPIPRVCAPTVYATETPGGQSRVLVSVTVKLPLVGILISYQGHLDVRKAA